MSPAARLASHGGRGTGPTLAFGPVLATALLAACAPARPAGAPPDASTPEPASTLRPAAEVGAVRSGTLRQDEISVRMTTGDLRIEITPLAPGVLEAAAPDTKRRLERIAAAHRPKLDSGAVGEDPVLFLVTFSTDRPAATFEPRDLHMISRGLRERPVSVDPISPNWSDRRLSQRGAALAVYAYRSAVDLSRELVVAYQGSEDSSWAGILAAVEAERGRTPTRGRSS